MQCPGCDHSATAEAFGDPAKCPACGVYYAKAEAHRRRLEAAAAKDHANDPEAEAPLDVVTGPHVSARSAKQALATFRLDNELAQPVVVVDLRMNFWSMVWFMVKWAVASIPALIILVVLFSLAFGFLMGLTGHMGGPPKI